MSPLLMPRTLNPAVVDDRLADLDALIEEARRRQRRRRIAVAVALAAMTAVGVGLYFGAFRSGGSGATGAGLPGGRLCVRNEPGWRSRFVRRPGVVPALLLTNFSFGRVDYLNGHTDPLLHWRRGGILISIGDWTRAATSAMRPEYPPTSSPPQLTAVDFRSFEGVRELGQRHVGFRGHLLEVWVQARPTTAATIAAANRELAHVDICG